MKKGMYIGVVVLLVAAFAASAIYLGNYFLEGKKQDDRYNELAQTVEKAQETENTEPTGPIEFKNNSAKLLELSEGEMLPGMWDLFLENQDLVGWISIENTKVDYPVLQTNTDNPNYYLYRNFDKEDNSWGAIYVRESCDFFEPSDNVTIFGHNMRDGSMFHSLNDYVEKEAWEKNSLIVLNNLYEFHVYKIFAVFKTTATVGEGFKYQLFENAQNAAEFNDFVSTCKELAFYDTGITPVYGDKLICLSTCEYTLDNGRLVVAAVRIS